MLGIISPRFRQSVTCSPSWEPEVIDITYNENDEKSNQSDFSVENGNCSLQANVDYLKRGCDDLEIWNNKLSDDYALLTQKLEEQKEIIVNLRQKLCQYEEIFGSLEVRLVGTSFHKTGDSTDF